ncbi:MAG: hypothetical protein LRY36_02430 [Alphaproteobacteria bacterium]|nr:hypothetical protein [Alphaproteobacteria bacterium]MCD8566761.1 hypothetical protein [Alphaproteobacteria bacterium]
MSCLLRFEHIGWDVLTSAWSVAAKNNNQNTTELVYSWGLGGNVSLARTTLDIPFNTFFNYIAACEEKNKIADLTEKNIPRIIAEYSHDPR